MKTFQLADYDMAYLDIGSGVPHRLHTWLTQ